MKTPEELAKEMFDFAKKTFAPGDMAQGYMFDAEGGMLAMLAIDSSFFANIGTRLRLQSMLKQKVAELKATTYVQVSDSWTLKNVDEVRMKEDPPPAHASVVWMSENGYGELQDQLVAFCQMPLGVWLVSQKYENDGGQAVFFGDVKVGPGRMEPYTEIIPQQREGHA